MIAEESIIHIASFNIRCDARRAFVGDPDCWLDREPILRQCLQVIAPDIIGFQEVMYHQIPAIQEGLGPNYSYVGNSRDDSKLGELCPIFYNSKRFFVSYWNQCWLSDEPKVKESNTWGNDATRIVTWAEFTEILTGKKFTFANTHFDHISEYSRTKSAELLTELFKDQTPVVLVGDFNADSSLEPKVYSILTSVFQDVFEVSENHLSPRYGTFSNYAAPNFEAKTIDWILTSRNVSVESTMIHTFNVAGRYPSDHLPISARLAIA